MWEVADISACIPRTLAIIVTLTNPPSAWNDPITSDIPPYAAHMVPRINGLAILFGIARLQTAVVSPLSPITSD